MEPRGLQVGCQLPCLPQVAEGHAASPPASLVRRLKLLIRRHLSPSRERMLKARTNEFSNWLSGPAGRRPRPAATQMQATARLQAGDLVRVRPKHQVEATLNHWRQLKGCTFMPEMAQYCGTTQRVLKPMERFVDERDLRVKRSRGIVLLEGVLCQGTADFGPCDRACHLFWREEWLEKID